jgi:hypothetical protein
LIIKSRYLFGSGKLLRFGVSKNTAEKPDFIQLAKAIVDKLTSNPESQSIHDDYYIFPFNALELS